MKGPAAALDERGAKDVAALLRGPAAAAAERTQAADASPSGSSAATAATASTATAPIRSSRGSPRSAPNGWKRCCMPIASGARKSTRDGRHVRA